MKTNKKWIGILPFHLTKGSDKERNYCSAVQNCPKCSQPFGMQLISQIGRPYSTDPGLLFLIVVTTGPINLRCSRTILERSKTNQSLFLWSFWRKICGFLHANPKGYSGDKKAREGEVGKPRRWSSRGLSVLPRWVRLGQSRVHARIYGAAKPKLIRVS